MSKKTPVIFTAFLALFLSHSPIWASHHTHVFDHDLNPEDVLTRQELEDYNAAVAEEEKYYQENKEEIIAAEKEAERLHYEAEKPRK